MKLKKFLMPFLLCSVFFFTLIPKTYADTSVTIGLSGEIRTIDDIFVSSFVNDSYITVQQGQFPIFVGMTIPMNFSKACGKSYVYRIDYTIWGWHNANKTADDWKKYARLIDYNSADYELEVLGTVIQYDNQYELNFSTFIEWTSTYCPVDSIGELDLSISDVPANLYFWNSSHNDTHDYATLNAIFGQVDKSLAVDLINDYYNGNPVNEKLDEIKGEILYTNEKLDDIKDELNSVNGNIDKTNEKLDDIYSTLTDNSLDTGKLQNSAGWLPAGPVDSILNLPLSLYENLLDVLQNGQTCPSLQINLPYLNETLSIPCLSDIFNSIDGLNVFWTSVGTIAGAFLLFNYLINLYKWVDATLTMRENNHFGGY